MNLSNAAEPYELSGPAPGNFGDRSGRESTDGSRVSKAETIESDAEAAKRLGTRVEILAVRAAGAGEARSAADCAAEPNPGAACKAAEPGRQPEVAASLLVTEPVSA